MSKETISYAFRALGLAVLAVVLTVPVSGDVISTMGQPVDGEVPGYVVELHSDESGLSEVYFQSDFDDLGVLILVNGDPAMGTNDLEQFGDVLREALSCGSGVDLQAVNGNVVGATLSAPRPNVICCINAHCSKKPERTCDRKGGTKGWTSMKDCIQNCL